MGAGGLHQHPVLVLVSPFYWRTPSSELYLYKWLIDHCHWASLLFDSMSIWVNIWHLLIAKHLILINEIRVPLVASLKLSRVFPKFTAWTNSCRNYRSSRSNCLLPVVPAGQGGCIRSGPANHFAFVGYPRHDGSFGRGCDGDSGLRPSIGSWHRPNRGSRRRIQGHRCSFSCRSHATQGR